MKTTLKIKEERIEHQKMDADELIQRMFSFIPLSERSASTAIISAKFCAKVACDYLIENLPNIDEIPSNSQKDEKTYIEYWIGVKYQLENYFNINETNAIK
jgi:hypothetical protein